MDSKPSSLSDSIMKLQALRERLRLTELAQIRQKQLRKEYEEKTEKLIAENDKISAKLLVKQNTTKKYKDLVECLISKKAELERKLHILQGRVQENEKVQCQNSNNPVLSQKTSATTTKSVKYTEFKEPVLNQKTHTTTKPIQYDEFKERVLNYNRPDTSTQSVRSEDFGESSFRYVRPDDIKYDDNEEIWELKKSIEEIESQLSALEKQKETEK